MTNGAAAYHRLIKSLGGEGPQHKSVDEAFTLSEFSERELGARLQEQLYLQPRSFSEWLERQQRRSSSFCAVITKSGLTVALACAGNQLMVFDTHGTCTMRSHKGMAVITEAVFQGLVSSSDKVSIVPPRGRRPFCASPPLPRVPRTFILSCQSPKVSLGVCCSVV